VEFYGKIIVRKQVLCFFEQGDNVGDKKNKRLSPPSSAIL
jgi:hypothetical protein